MAKVRNWSSACFRRRTATFRSSRASSGSDSRISTSVLSSRFIVRCGRKARARFSNTRRCRIPWDSLRQPMRHNDSWPRSTYPGTGYPARCASTLFLEIDLETFEVEQDGFLARRMGERSMYTSAGLSHLERIGQLADSEYGQAVEVDRQQRSVSFGRDFLGHHPLSYATANGRLFISDSLQRLVHALGLNGVTATPSEEAIALYFSMGYVPPGFSAFREIDNSRAAGFYPWSKGSVRLTRQFEPLEVDEAASANDLAEAIESEISRIAVNAPAIDVWCSGGLDSSIMALRFNSGHRRADLLTLAYGREIHQQLGDGERRFAREVADACGARLREVNLHCRKFEDMHETFVRFHNSPVIDTPLPPKYALAEASRGLAITGEGGDNFFGGVKNTS